MKTALSKVTGVEENDSCDSPFTNSYINSFWSTDPTVSIIVVPVTN